MGANFVGMAAPVQRPHEVLHYWRDRDLREATLLRAHYGQFQWERHFHDEMVIVISERGSGQVITRAGTDVGGAGSVWVFAPGEYHYGRVDSDDGWDYRALYVEVSELDRIATNFGLEKGRLYVPPGLYDDEELASVLLCAHASGEKSRSLIDEQIAWNDAFAALFCRYGRPKPSSKLPHLGQSALALAREYVMEHYREDISVDALARLSGVSRYHFIREFRNAFGLPPHAFLNQVRLQQARKLLLAGHKAAEAAGDSGFYDQSRLTRLFKRAYGLSPAQYANLSRR